MRRRHPRSKKLSQAPLESAGAGRPRRGPKVVCSRNLAAAREATDEDDDEVVVVDSWRLPLRSHHRPDL